MQRERREEFKHQNGWNNKASFDTVLELIADLEAAEAKLQECEGDYTAFVNDVLQNADESWDDDVSAHVIALEYVRHLENGLKVAEARLAGVEQSEQHWKEMAFALGQRAEAAEEKIKRLHAGLIEIQRYTKTDDPNFRRCYELLRSSQ